MADSDATPETDDQLKKRARRRLVGAAALALFAVIVLPMVMDHEPRPAPPDIQVRIPSQDASFVSRISPGKPVPTPMPPDAPPEPAKGPARPEPSKAAEKPAEKVAEKAAEKVAEKAQEKPAEKAAETPKPVTSKVEPATKAPPPKPPPKAAGEAAPGGEQWVVQIGTYKNTGNVAVLLGKFKEVGVPSYTEKVESGTRVRVGPFPSREAAEKAQAKIRRIGVDGPVAQK